MEPLRLTFLGTGSAIPTKKHNHTAFLISYRDENLLFDCGEGTQRQFRYANLSPTKITRIFLTHWHGDHILGIPGLLQTLALNNYNKKLYIYGPKGTKHFMEKLFETFVFVGNINHEIKEIDSNKVLETSDFIVEAGRTTHGTESLCYSFIEKTKTRLDKKKLKKLKVPNSPLLKDLAQGKDIIINGKKIKAKDVVYTQKGRKITIITDTKLNNNLLSIAENSDILICEASFDKSQIETAEEYNHLTSEQAATIAKKSKSKALYLTHLSQRYDANQKLIENEAKKIFKNSKLANDLDVVEI